MSVSHDWIDVFVSAVRPAKALVTTLAMLIIAVPNQVAECEDECEKPVVTMNKNLLDLVSLHGVGL